jgi:ketosteroid isomerase-like protein
VTALPDAGGPATSSALPDNSIRLRGRPAPPFHPKEEFMDTPMAVVKRAYQAFGRNDIEGVLECIAPTVDWRIVGPASLPFPTQCHTRQEVARFFKELAADGDITIFEPREFIDANEHIVVLGFVQVTLAETGKPFESEWVHICTVKDGLLTRWIEFFDTAARVNA